MDHKCALRELQQCATLVGALVLHSAWNALGRLVDQ